MRLLRLYPFAIMFFGCVFFVAADWIYPASPVRALGAGLAIFFAGMACEYMEGRS